MARFHLSSDPSVTIWTHGHSFCIKKETKSMRSFSNHLFILDPSYDQYDYDDQYDGGDDDDHPILL